MRVQQINHRGRRLRQATVAGGLALAMATTAFSGTAAASSDDEGPSNLLACIVAKGATAPGPEGVTNAWIDQVVAAARACGVELPDALIAEVRRQASELESKRACLEASGLTKPADGQLPTSEQLAAYVAAARACGFDDKPESPRGDDAATAPREQTKPAAKERERQRPAAKKRQRNGSRSTAAKRTTRRGTSKR